MFCVDLLYFHPTAITLCIDSFRVRRRQTVFSFFFSFFNSVAWPSAHCNFSALRFAKSLRNTHNNSNDNNDVGDRTSFHFILFFFTATFNRFRSNPFARGSPTYNAGVQGYTPREPWTYFNGPQHDAIYTTPQIFRNRVHFLSYLWTCMIQMNSKKCTYAIPHEFNVTVASTIGF